MRDATVQQYTTSLHIQDPATTLPDVSECCNSRHNVQMYRILIPVLRAVAR